MEHIDIHSMDVRQFQLNPNIQYIISRLQHGLNIKYNFDGKTQYSEKDFNLIFPDSFGSARRKPVTEEFQKYGETIFYPILKTLIFGKEGWKNIEKHSMTTKINTIKYSEDTDYYGKNIYHMHLDNKIGMPNLKDKTQIQKIRVIFSIVPESIDNGNDTENTNYQSTVYLKSQPIPGFFKQDKFHEYMGKRYDVLQDTLRPLYIIPDNEVCRAKPGEILVHYSHPGYPIHAEANPCPDRTLYAFDFQDIPGTRIPTKYIVDCMQVLESPSDEYNKRLEDTVEIAKHILIYPNNQITFDNADKCGVGRKLIKEFMTMCIK